MITIPKTDTTEKPKKNTNSYYHVPAFYHANTIFAALLAGKKLRATYWASGHYICLYNNKIINQDKKVITHFNIENESYDEYFDE